MSPSKSLRYTRLLVLAGVLAGLASFPTALLGWGELYPFFHWKLYSQPLGNDYHFSGYRIYTQAKGQHQWQRQKIEEVPEHWSEDDYVYALSYFVGRYAENPTAENRQKLQRLVRDLEPGFQRYKVVKEMYRPLQLPDNPKAFDTTSLLTF